MATPNKPIWEIPPTLVDLMTADDDLTWETSDWEPFNLKVVGGTKYKGRDIEQSWQIEFDPSSEDFENANAKLSAMNVEPDGYGWANLIDSVVKNTT